MEKIFGRVALLVGMATSANVQVNGTIQRTTGNDPCQGIARKLPYWQMVTPRGVRTTLTKTAHIVFSSAVRYVDLGSSWVIAGKADGAESVIQVRVATGGFPGETSFSVIREDGSFYSFNVRYAHEPEMLSVEMKGFLENGDATDFSHAHINIHFRELTSESPSLMELIMRDIYKKNRREIRHLGCERFGVQFLLKSVHSHNGLFYFHTETRNRSNMTFRTDFIRFRTVDKKVPKRTVIQERVIDPAHSYNEVLVMEGKSDVRTVYVVPQFTILDGKLLIIDLLEKDDNRHQIVRVENTDSVVVRQTNELKIK